MLKIKNMVLLLLLGVVVNGCGSDRASSVDSSDQKGVLGVVAKDSDVDGLSDDDEINIYHTNPNNKDTDGDGLIDGEEVRKYHTNPLEVDTDGDCLLDSFEVLNYETNATDKDTDNDGVEDGIEIYSYDLLHLNRSCIQSPETLRSGANSTPAKDNYPSANNDPINALDPRMDSDGDGISNRDENQSGTNPFNSDSDGDGISDTDEIKYGTNPLKADSDNDGLKDGDEINIYDTNASNPDTDGDCLLDSFEILNYKTDAKSKDTDKDGVDDGIEIYSMGKDDLNVTCLRIPETLIGGKNDSPEMDAIPDVAHDIINALDPTNDSDGDKQSNIKETTCVEGNPVDILKLCPYIIDGSVGETMSEHGYAYVPGGFDVDGDGTVEGGFWMSRYQARKTDELISSEDVIKDVGDINQYVYNHFKVLNLNIQVTKYSEGRLNETTTFAGNKLTFDESIARSLKRVTGVTPYLALVSLHRSKILDKNTGEALDLNITLPSMKQYVQVKRLLDADKRTGSDGRHIRNGLLGTDPNVPLSEYTLVIDEFDEEKKEYVKNLIQLRDTSVVDGESIFDASKIVDWWDVDSSKFEILNHGANATQDLGFGIGVEKDAYAVMVRAGGALDLRQGMSGALTDDEGTTNGISFRAATDYLW